MASLCVNQIRKSVWSEWVVVMITAAVELAEPFLASSSKQLAS